VVRGHVVVGVVGWFDARISKLDPGPPGRSLPGAPGLPLTIRDPPDDPIQGTVARPAFSTRAGDTKKHPLLVELLPSFAHKVEHRNLKVKLGPIWPVFPLSIVEKGHDAL
jgi:hypothetical protein